jgi:hypothetical protein
MEQIRGSDEERARYEHYMRLLSSDAEYDLNMLERHRIAVMFVIVDRFRNIEMAMTEEEWLGFLMKHVSVAELMRKYEQYSLDYLGKKKEVDRRGDSVFDKVNSLVMEMRGGSGELKIEWKGEEILEGDIIEYDTGLEDTGEEGTGEDTDTTQPAEGDGPSSDQIQVEEEREDSG